MMWEVHAQGKSVEDIAECLMRVPLHPLVIASIKAAYDYGRRMNGNVTVGNRGVGGTILGWGRVGPEEAGGGRRRPEESATGHPYFSALKKKENERGCALSRFAGRRYR
ncbi:hypothetical protein SAY87_026823 [Trapa incisa]|uniref:Uncharacterized protein n=1 Tax=Trapa incisa TaxID=236973 RepID=A0AAN7GV23_9MYRT|nr:hypothetical protein SAY87_026823 [Trapa incisa]